MVLSSRSLYVSRVHYQAQELGERNDISQHLAHYSIVAKIGAGGMGGGLAKCLWRFLPNRKAVKSAMFRLRCCEHSNMSLLTERKKDSECTTSDKHIPPLEGR